MSDDARILELTVRSPEPDSPGLRRRIGAGLGLLALRSRSAAPSAVLAVRRLEAPREYPCSIDELRAWHAATEAELERLERGAVRHRGGAVPADAQAVLFAGPAEWLAALLVTLARGDPWPWWADGLVPGKPEIGPGSIAALLRERIDLAAPALAVLHASGHAPAVVERVRPRVARELAERLVELYGDRDAREKLRARLGPSTGPGRARGAPMDVTVHGESTLLSVRPEPTDELAALEAAQCALLITALELRDPLAAASLDRRRAGRPARPQRPWRRPVATNSSAPESAADALPEPASPLDATSAEIEVEQLESSHAHPTGDSHSPGVEHASTSPTSPTEQRGEPPRVGEPNAPLGVDTVRPTGSTVTPASQPEQEPLRIALENGVPTRFGGALFLVPALVYRTRLEPELAPGLGLVGPLLDFAMVGFLARELLARDRVGHDDDALWPVLAELAALPPGAPLEPRFLAPRHRMRFLDEVLPDWSRDLREGLELGQHELLSAALLLRPATLYASATHLDLVLELEACTPAVRRAGLDLDPGWVPELGRVIQFHYEPGGGHGIG